MSMKLTLFASGSGGNCALFTNGKTHILIDAGISMKRIVQNLGYAGLSLSDVSGILITHEHSDHVGGLKTLIKHCDTPIYASRGTAHWLWDNLPGIEKQLCEFQAGDCFSLGETEVASFSTPHDAADSVGYTLAGEDGRLLFCTDLGCLTDAVLAAAEGCAAAVIEANHDEAMLRYGVYPYALKQRILSDRGHLSNERSACFARHLASLGTETLVLAHISRENNTPEKAYAVVSAALQEAGASPKLLIAPPAEPLTVEVSPCRV